LRGRPGVPARAAARLLALLLALLLGPAAARPARASTEEFATFDVERMEEDDESILDHLLTRPPRQWEDEWARAPQAFRTTQGCFTSGQWYMDHQLRVLTPMGKQARFGLRLDQVESDLTTYQDLDLWFLFPQRSGTLGVMFRPFYDKSRQDFAVQWELGADSTRDQLRLTYGLEDLFNNLWVWRQTRVGENGDPYERHPWEPAFKAALRRPRWRVEAEGKWLTLARKQVGVYDGSAPRRAQTLWGTWGTLALDVRALGVTWMARSENRQARSTDQPLDLTSGDARTSRRLWQAELAARGGPRRDLTVEARWLYVDRMQSYRAPLPAARFHALDRTLQLETVWTARPRLAVRLGGLFDRVRVRKSGDTGRFTWGDRNESRAYVGLLARFGRVSLSGVEGIELDPEHYEVWHHHDKGFLMLQTTF